MHVRPHSGNPSEERTQTSIADARDGVQQYNTRSCRLRFLTEEIVHRLPFEYLAPFVHSTYHNAAASDDIPILNLQQQYSSPWAWWGFRILCAGRQSKEVFYKSPPYCFSAGSWRDREVWQEGKWSACKHLVDLAHVFSFREPLSLFVSSLLPSVGSDLGTFWKQIMEFFSSQDV